MLWREGSVGAASCARVNQGLARGGALSAQMCSPVEQVCLIPLM